MPHVRVMLPIACMQTYETISNDESRSAFERAYAGASWLTAAASTRTIDMRRTPTVGFETTTFEDERYIIACGIAERSKGATARTMRPLAWRAPIVTIGTEAVDLVPLLDAGCSLFRDFEVPKGMPHDITHATAWANKTASHDTVVQSQRALLRHLLEDRTNEHGGHDHRHIVPELARVAGMSRERREQIGYWRAQGAVGDGADDQQALRRAIMAARALPASAGPTRFSSDRYSSQDAAPVASDVTRIACLRIAAGALSEWDRVGAPMPSTTREEVNAVKEYVAKNGSAPA